MAKQKKLTAAQLRLLRYPPTQTTWICPGRYKDSEGEQHNCLAYNTGKRKKCWLCTRLKPSKPQLVWPDYVTACEIAGIQPGEKYKTLELAPTPARRKR